MISDKTAERIAELCNAAARSAIDHRTLADRAWESINKTTRREIDPLEDFGADVFVDSIEYGSPITAEEVKKYIATLRENREASSGLVRK